MVNVTFQTQIYKDLFRILEWHQSLFELIVTVPPPKSPFSFFYRAKTCPPISGQLDRDVFIQTSPFSSFMTILALGNVCSLRWYFHTSQKARRDLSLCCSVQYLPTCDLTLIYITFKVTPIPCLSLSCYFCILGFGEGSPLNYLKVLWIGMFICTAQNDLPLFVQCF